MLECDQREGRLRVTRAPVCSRRRVFRLDQASHRPRDPSLATSRPVPAGATRPHSQPQQHQQHLQAPGAPAKLSVSTSTSSAVGSGQASSGSGPQSSPGVMQPSFPTRPPPQGRSQPPARVTTSRASLVEKLCNACGRGDIPQVNELLRIGAPLEPDKEGRSAIHYASQNGHSTATRMLLDAGQSVDVEDNLGYTALHRAAAQGHRETVQLLISRGANINKQDNVHGNTALHEAAWNGYAQTVGILCGARANANIFNKANFTALHLAAQNGHNQSARVLLYAGCESNAKNNYGDTALHTAARYGHAGVTRILISARARINETNKNGDTALHISAALKRRKITKLLMEAGVDTGVRNKQNETALDVARRKSHAEIVHLILNTPSANVQPAFHALHPVGNWRAPIPGPPNPPPGPVLGLHPMPMAAHNPNHGYQPLLAPVSGAAPVYESMLTLGGSKMHLPLNGDANGAAPAPPAEPDASRAPKAAPAPPAPAAAKKKGLFGGWFLRKKKEKPPEAAEAPNRKSDPQPTNGAAAQQPAPTMHPMQLHHPAMQPAMQHGFAPTQYYRDLAGNVRQMQKYPRGPVGYMSCSCLHHAALTGSLAPHASVYGGNLLSAPYHVPCVDHGYAEYHGPVLMPGGVVGDNGGAQAPRMVRSRSDESLSMSEHKAKSQEEKARQMAMRELKAMRAAAGASRATGPVQGRRAVSPSSYVPRISVADARARVEPPPTTHQSHLPPNRHSDILSKMESIQREYTRPSPDGSNDQHLGRSPLSTEDTSPAALHHLQHPHQATVTAADRNRVASQQLQAWYAKHGRPSALQPRAKPSPANPRMSTDV